MSSSDAAALGWCARLFIAIGLGLAFLGGRSGLETYRFISESRQTDGTVVDWTQGDWRAGSSHEPGAYYAVIEVIASDGRPLRGEAETGVGMGQLRIGERLPVRYRPADPTRMRVVSFTGLWLQELIFALLAIAFCTAGTFLLRQARRS